MLETLIIIRNILLRTVIISIIYVFIIFICYLSMQNFMISMIDQVYKINAEQSHILIVHFIALIKFFILFVLLFPALAIHWTIKKIETKKK